MVREERTAEYDTETTTASEAELRGLIRRAADAQRSPHCRMALGIFLVAALLAAGAAVAMMQAGPSETIGDSVALAGNGAWTKSVRMGCENWKTLAIKKGVSADAATCGLSCSQTTGCWGFGFQPGVCGTDGDGDQPLACYLWGGTCQEAHNPCWDQYNMVQPNAAKWVRKATRTGCANWQTAQIGATSTKMSAGECGLTCLAATGCTGFNFQPGPCSGSEMVGAGACMLFQGACVQEGNNCWDLYEMLSDSIIFSTGLAKDVSKGDKIIYVNDLSQFEPGDTITITDGAQAQTVKVAVVGQPRVRRLSSANSLTIEEAALYDFSKESTLVNLNEKGTPTSSSTEAPTPDTTLAAVATTAI